MLLGGSFLLLVHELTGAVLLAELEVSREGAAGALQRWWRASRQTRGDRASGEGKKES